jgi:hypothetical protein
MILKSRLYRSTLWIGLAFFSLPLAGYALTGSLSRYLQDDYCYSAYIRANGFWRAQANAYFIDTPFSGNRYTLTLFVAISEWFGQASVQVLPALAIAAWVSGWYVLLRQSAHAFGWTINRIESILISTGLVFFTLYLAPNRVQALYWRPGMLPYLAPLVLLTWLLAWIVHSIGLPRGERASVALLAEVALAAFLSGGLSETAAALQVGAFGLALLAGLIALRARSQAALPAFRLSWAAELGSLVSLYVLTISPSMHFRQAKLAPLPENPLSILLLAMDSARFFVVYTLYRLILPTLALFGLAFCLAFAAAGLRGNLPRVRLSTLLLRLAATLAGMFLLLVCITGPSSFAEATYPEARVMVMARCVVTLTTALCGFWLGQAASAWLGSRGKESLAPILWVPMAGIYIFALWGVNPGALVEPAYPDLRGFLFTHLPMLLFGLPVLLAAGWAIGRLIPRSPGIHLVMVVLSLAFLFQPLFALRPIAFEWPDYQLRAQMWDLRDAQIRAAHDQGSRAIQVRALDSLAGIGELKAVSSDWVNNCASMYYGVDSITAVEPILNPPTH